MRVSAAAVVGGVPRYYAVSDWGYTRDGTPGLQARLGNENIVSLIISYYK